MFAITHIGQKSNSIDIVIHEDKYRVVNDDHSLKFEGTYTQCLIYVGALEMGKSPITARQYALGRYV